MIQETEITHMLQKNNISFVPSIQLSMYQFERIPLIELETNNKDGIYNKVRQAIKPVVNYNWDNNILRITNIFGDEFSIHVYLAKKLETPLHWEITLWDHLGTTTIGVWKKNYVSNEDKLSPDEINEIKKRLEEFTQHILHCSDCQTAMPSDNRIKKTEVHEKEYGGQYFAGHYCKDCWERKWKAIEAKEKYN
jgi:hypothetical protein